MSQMPSWKSVSADFGDANKSLSTSVSALGSAGTLFSNLSQQIEQEKQNDINNAFKAETLKLQQAEAERQQAEFDHKMETDMETSMANEILGSLRAKHLNKDGTYNVQAIALEASQLDDNLQTAGARQFLFEGIDSMAKDSQTATQHLKEDARVWAQIGNDRARIAETARHNLATEEHDVNNLEYLKNKLAEDTKIDAEKNQINLLKAQNSGASNILSTQKFNKEITDDANAQLATLAVNQYEEFKAQEGNEDVTFSQYLKMNKVSPEEQANIMSSEAAKGLFDSQRTERERIATEQRAARAEWTKAAKAKAAQDRLKSDGTVQAMAEEFVRRFSENVSGIIPSAIGGEGGPAKIENAIGQIASSALTQNVSKPILQDVLNTLATTGLDIISSQGAIPDKMFDDFITAAEDLQNQKPNMFVLKLIAHLNAEGKATPYQKLYVQKMYPELTAVDTSRTYSTKELNSLDNVSIAPVSAIDSSLKESYKAVTVGADPIPNVYKASSEFLNRDYNKELEILRTSTKSKSSKAEMNRALNMLLNTKVLTRAQLSEIMKKPESQIRSALKKYMQDQFN